MNTKEYKFPMAGVFFLMGVIAKFLTLTMQSSINKEYFFAGMVALGVLSVAVFTKENKVVSIATAMLLVVGIIPLFTSGRILGAHVLGFGIALVIMLVCGVSKYEKYKPIAAKIWFVPGGIILAAYLIQPLLYIPYGMNWLRVVFEYAVRMGDFYTAIGYLFLMKWMLNPYAEENATVNMYCGIGKHIILYYSTLGIWFYCWVYNITKTLNSALPNEKQYDPAVQLVLNIFVPFYHAFWLYENGKRVDYYAKEVGVEGVNTATVCLVLGILFPFIASCVLQSGINKIYRRL